MSTADHPQKDDQIERVSKVVYHLFCSFCADLPKTWSSMLLVVEFASNNAVHASIGFTPIEVNQ